MRLLSPSRCDTRCLRRAADCVHPQAKLASDQKSLTLVPFPATVNGADGSVLLTWDTLQGAGSQDSSFQLDRSASCLPLFSQSPLTRVAVVLSVSVPVPVRSDSWRACNLTQTGDEFAITCFLKDGGQCTFNYFCMDGPCKQSSPGEEKPAQEVANDDEAKVRRAGCAACCLLLVLTSAHPCARPQDAVTEEPKRVYTWRDLPGVFNLTNPQATQ